MTLRAEASPGYRHLFDVRGFARLLAATLLVRTGGSIWEFGLVLFTLQKFHSPGIAGVTVFLSIAPGIVISPLVGVLLDRHGRVRLMILDYLIAGTIALLIVWLSVSGRLTVALLLPAVAVGALTNPLGTVGSRTLFPLLVPRQLWDRANALDSLGYTLPAIVGPALAGALTAARGAELALFVSAAFFLGAAIVMLSVREPRSATPAADRLLPAAWGAVRYVLRNPSLRGIALGLSLLNIGMAAVLVGLPVLVFERLHGSPALVGQLWAVQGAAGVVGSLVAGRLNTEGRERMLLAATMLVSAISLSVLAVASNLWLVVLAMILQGSTGPGDVAMFSLRQRRTHPAWFGRAFAVSMNLNFAGVPVGAAISGQIIQRSLTAAFVLGIALCLGAAAVTYLLIPEQSDD